MVQISTFLIVSNIHMANEYAIYSTPIIVNSLKLGRYTAMRIQAQTL